MASNQSFQAKFGALTDELVQTLTQIPPEVRSYFGLICLMLD